MVPLKSLNDVIRLLYDISVSKLSLNYLYGFFCYNKLNYNLGILPSLKVNLGRKLEIQKYLLKDVCSISKQLNMSFLFFNKTLLFFLLNFVNRLIFLKINLLVNDK